MTNLDRPIADLIADGMISAEDALAVREFVAFLTDPELRPMGQPQSLRLLREHADFLGLSEAEIDRVEAIRAMGVLPDQGDPEVEAGAAAVARLRAIFKGVLPDDVTIARAVLASAAKLRHEQATLTPGNNQPEG